MFRKQFVAQIVAQRGIACALLAISTQAAVGQECQPQWLPAFGGQPGVEFGVEALQVFDDQLGSGDALYIAGHFERAGGIEASRIAKWDGPIEGWSALGAGLNNSVSALAVYDDGNGSALFAAGSFTSAGNVQANLIAKWDGNAWSALGAGLGGGPSAVYVQALAVFDDGAGSGPALYAAGKFQSAGGDPANNVAKWNGTTWTAVGSGFQGTVNALAVFDDGSGGGPALYAGERFGVKKWTGSAWAVMGGTFNDQVTALTVFDGHLHAAGDFTSPANHIAKWNSAIWSPLGSGIDSSNGPQVACLGVFDDGDGPELIAGGAFHTAGGVPANRIAKWDGAVWHPLAEGMFETLIPYVAALAVFDDGTGGGPALFAGGTFEIAGTNAAASIARWDGASWSRLGSGFSGPVHALIGIDQPSAGDSANVYAGGEFLCAGDTEARRIARWDGSAWHDVGGGANNWVRALAVFDEGLGHGAALYAGGHFTMVGGVNANHVARWDGSSWSALDSGGIGIVNAMTAFDTGTGERPALVVAGYNIAKWDGQVWSTLGTGMDDVVWSLAVFDDGSGSGASLYAGGAFHTVSGVTVSRIARWDGSKWLPVGGGMNQRVWTLTVFDDGSGDGPALYAGGIFTMAGGNSIPHLAKWDGSTWSDVGGGPGGFVRTLLVHDEAPGASAGPSLLAGGSFSSAGRTYRLAKWNGESWSHFGDGLNGGVMALIAWEEAPDIGPALLVGGSFYASPTGDSFLAQWQLCAEPEPVPGDINGDHVVNITDLLAVIASWGACQGLCPADITGDGTVNIADLLFVIANWG